MRLNKWKAVLIISFSLLFFCCGAAFAQAPTVTSISPTSGPVSTLVTITGTNFVPGTTSVSLNGANASVLSCTSSTILALVPASASSGTFAVTVNGSTANSSSFTVTSLPSGWSDGDIGSVGVAGSASYANGTFTVAGAGSEIYGSSDSFHFAYQSLSGDGTIVARVVRVQGGSSYATAGVMIRETLDPAATNAKTADWPAYSGIYFDLRSSTGNYTSEPGSASAVPPYWVKIVRSGSTFSSYASPDGATWTQLGSSQTISMQTNVYVGLAVDSANTSAVATATFDNVSVSTPSNPAPVITSITPTSGGVGTQIQISGSGFGTSEGSSVVLLNGTVMSGSSWSSTSITANVPSGAMTGPLVVSVGPSMNVSNAVNFQVLLPSPWQDQDLGTTGLAGEAGFANGAFTVMGAGASGTFSTPDEVHFAYQPLSGDGTIIARLVSLQGSGAAQAGLMIRETLDPSATNLFLCDYASNIFPTERTSTGGSSSYSDVGSLTPPYWLEISRTGNTFNMYGSVDGVTWTQLGTSQTITMAQNVYIGLAVSNRSSTSLATATFDNVSINSAASPAPVISSLSATTSPIGSQIVIFGSNFGTTQGGSLVTLNGAPLTISLWTSTAIVVTIPSGATSGPILVSIAPSMNDSNAIYFWVTSQPLPQTWLDQDLSPAGGIGNGTYSTGTGQFTISGEGAGIGSVADGMHFAYEPLSGDGTIVARLVSLQGGSSAAQAGVVIRETLSPGASFVGLIYGSTYLDTYERTSTGAGATYQTDVGVTLPYWLKLVRAGNTFTTYASSDGVNWVLAGTSDTVTMAQNVYIGLAVSNNSSTHALATATFDNISISSTANPAPVITAVSATTGSVGNQVVISGNNFGATEGSSVVRLNGALVTLNSWTNTSIIITIPTGATSGPLLVSVAPSMNDSNAVNFTVTTQPLPIPWLDQDVGIVGVVGSGTYAGGTFTVKGAGSTGTFSTPDTIHFVYQPLSGDGTIVARVASFTGSSAGQAGVMIRDTLDPSASNADTSYYSSSIFMLDRPTDGGSSSYQQWGNGSVTLPYWVKLVRSGSTFYSYGSADGVTWYQAGTSQTVTMGQNAFVGLAVSNRSATSLGTATFDNVSVTIGSTPFVTGAYPALGPVGTSVTITGSNFGSSQGTSTVTFNGVAATTVTSWTSTQVVATVPSGTPAGTGPVNVTVNSIAGITSASFTAIEPVVSSVTPPAASINGTVTVSGSGFGPNQASSQILFNGVPVGFSTWSDTSIVVNIPPGTTSGPVTVNVDGVVSNGVQFTVLEPLSITGISTTSGPAGSSVTITGTGFGPSQSNSLANFYGAAATVTSWSDTSVTVNVPLGGVSGPVSMEVGSAIIWGPTFTLTKTVQLTDSQSNQTTYTSALIGGSWVPLSSQGSGCTTCTLRGQLSYTYDGNGNMLTKTDELGHVTTYTYDTNGNLLTVTVPIDANTTATTTYTYNSFGQVLTVTDPLGNVATNSYDGNGNLLTVTTPAPSGGGSGSVTTFTYDSKGELLTITDPLSHVTSLTYTTVGLIATITDAQSNVTTYSYDSHGNRTSVKDALNHTTTFAYDAGDRLTTITYPDSTTTTFTYDARGRRTSVTDQNGKSTTYAYDDADRLTSVTDAATNVTTYGYDTEDNLTSITDANSHTTSFAYDAFGRVTKATFPSTLFENYAYDAANNLTSKTDRKNQQITYTYDQLNRLTQKSYPDSTTVNYTYDKDSRLTQVTDPTGTHAFTFDNMGRLTNTTTSYAFLTGRNFTTAYGYDAASNRTSFTDPESGSTAYVYDTLNRLQTLTPPAAYGGGSFGFGYDALSRRTNLTRPNAVNTAYSYDNLSRLLSATHAKSGTTLDGVSYTVDNAGNRTSRTPLPGTSATNYTYDAIYELLTAKQGTTTTESYTYDPVGNRLSSLGVSSYSNNSSNEMTAKTGTTYTFDNNGNTLTKVDSTGTTTYTWDFENRLTSVAPPGSGGTVSFKYDPFGRRIYKSSSSGTSIYAYDGDNLIEETNSSGTVVARYSQGLNNDEPLAMLRAGATNYYNADDLGSITSLTNSSGAIAQSYAFDSFGNMTNSSGSLTNPFRFLGRELDNETGLYYFRARYFDSQVAKFISEDPIGFSSGDINDYRYSFNSPVNLDDPSGLAPGLPGFCRKDYEDCAKKAFGSTQGNVPGSNNRSIPGYEASLIVLQGSLAVGADPTTVAITMAFESNSNLQALTNLNTNGSIDIGPMQLNTDVANNGGFHLFPGSLADAQGNFPAPGDPFGGDPLSNVMTGALYLRSLGSHPENYAAPVFRPSRARSLRKLDKAFRKFFNCLQSATLPQ